jgi:hypothetical protein
MAGMHPAMFPPQGMYGPPGMAGMFPPMPMPGATADELEHRAAQLEAQARQLKQEARRAELYATQMKQQASPMMMPNYYGQPPFDDVNNIPALIEQPEWTPKTVKQPSKSTAQASEKAKPKKVKDSSASKSLPSSSSSTEQTTVMLRNIPNNYTREMLLELLDTQGFKGQYDFIYLPMDFSRMAGLGYAFINLVSNAAAEKVKAHFEGFSGWSLASQKVCEVSWGEPLQGLSAHIERYRNSPVMHEDVNEKYRPLLFQDGVKIEFPPPTKKIRPPRVKRSCIGSKGDKGGDDGGGGIDD